MKKILLRFCGILVFPFLILMLALNGLSSDIAGDYESGEDSTYETWKSYKNYFWRDK